MTLSTREAGRRPSLAKAVLTDSQFWLPVAVLLMGIAVLMVVR